LATTTARPWQAQIVEELDRHTLESGIEGKTHAAVWVPDDLENEEAELLGVADTEMEAIVTAEDLGAQRTGGEARVLKLADLVAWARDNDTVVDGPTIEPRRQNVEEGEPAETIEQPNPGTDTPPAPEPEPQPGEQAKAFDPSEYDREDLQIPKVDGQSIDRIAIKFGGEIHLDRSEPSDVALYNALRFGKDVAMLVEGRCNATGAKGATDREGDLDVVIGQKSVKVHSISKPAGGDWVEEA
jgi:hypothetical protein